MKRAKQHNGSAAEVEAAFYDALNRADVDALMLLWADDDEIFCIHPGGPRLHGHAAIQASWEAILEQGGLQIRPSQLTETHNLMSAVHTVVEGVTVRHGRAGPPGRHQRLHEDAARLAHGAAPRVGGARPGAGRPHQPSSSSLH